MRDRWRREPLPPSTAALSPLGWAALLPAMISDAALASDSTPRQAPDQEFADAVREERWLRWRIFGRSIALAARSLRTTTRARHG